MTFLRSFDELLNGILTDYRNQNPDIDISQGSLVFIKSACLASALWGLYHNLDYLSRQIFPDTADDDNVIRHAAIRGLEQRSTETVAELQTRLLDYIRRPPAGGNRYDYVKWALSVEGVGSAWCFPLANGIGTVDVVITADPDSGSELPTADLIATVRDYIDSIRPVTASSVRVMGPDLLLIDITMVLTGVSANPAQCAADVAAYLSSFIPGQPLYLAQLINIAVLNGADTATISAPVTTVTPVTYQLIRPGGISVT